MARIRSIKPEFWTSEQVMNCSRDARCLFIGLWNFCDDGGNHPASVRTLKAEVFPGDDDANMEAMMRWVDELIEQGLLAEYEADGKEFWHVTGWHHQRIDQPTLRHPTGDTGDAGSARHPKRLGGKQRQLLIKKLRERDGDTCHLCGDAPGVTLARISDPPPGNPHDIRTYRLSCTSCRQKKPACESSMTHGDARYVASDSPTEWSGRESNGGEGKGNGGGVGSSSVVGPVDNSESPPPLSADEIGESLVRLEAERGKTVSLSSRAREALLRIADRRIAMPVLLRAHAFARARRDADRDGSAVNPGFLEPFVDEALAEGRGGGVPGTDWDATTDGVLAKARDLGVRQDDGEPWLWFRLRVIRAAGDQRLIEREVSKAERMNPNEFERVHVLMYGVAPGQVVAA